MGRAAGLGVGALLLASLPLSAQDDETAEKAVDQFVTAMDAAGATDEDRVLAIRRVGVVKHERVVEALKPYLTSRANGVRIVTARALAQFDRVPCAVKALVDGYVNEANRPEAMGAVRIAMLQAFGTLRAGEAVELVNRAIESPNVWLAKAGVDAAGRIRHKSSIQLLVNLLERLDSRDGGELVDEENPLGDPLEEQFGMAPGVRDRARHYGETAEAPKRKRTMRDVLREPAAAALKAITRREFKTGAEWRRWWMANRSKYQVPK